MSNAAALERAWNDENLSEVVRIARRMINEDPNNVDALLKLAYVYALPLPEYSDYEAAIELVSTAHSQYPENRSVTFATADILKACGEYGEAEIICRRYLEKVDNDSDFLCVLASLREHPGVSVTIGEAEELLKRAVQNNPSDWRALATQAQLYSSRGDVERAGPIYENAITHARLCDPKHAEALQLELQRMLRRQ